MYEYLNENANCYSRYNLAKDPSETHNLAAKNTKKLRSMMEEMVRELESMAAVYLVKNGQELKPVVPKNP